jgi:hypothetical protein
MEKSIDLKHKIIVTGLTEKLIISIRLNDECKNGHADFAITADGYEKRRNNIWADSFGGCCHEEILKKRPNLKIFVDLHLSDSNGCPMYAIENGFCHLWDKTKTSEERKKIVMEYLRVNEQEYNILSQAKEKDYFHYLIDKLELPKKWKQEAKEAIIILEEMTGQKWDDNYKWERSQYSPLSEEKQKEIEQKIKNGYYSDIAIKQREEQKRKLNIQQQIKEIQKELEADIQKVKIEANIKIWLIEKIEQIREKRRKKNLDFLMTEKNSIYYNHTNELAFNWLSYEHKITQEDFKIFCNSIKEKEFSYILPKGIKFLLKDNDKIILIFSK